MNLRSESIFAYLICSILSVVSVTWIIFYVFFMRVLEIPPRRLLIPWGVYVAVFGVFGYALRRARKAYIERGEFRGISRSVGAFMGFFVIGVGVVLKLERNLGTGFFCMYVLSALLLIPLSVAIAEGIQGSGRGE
jgi:hypothetical protein